jgi:hypothetical protein
MVGVFWPDEKDLAAQGWWATEAWESGPAYGDLVTALRPVLRAAALHGYRLSSINIGFGPGIAGAGEWQRIDMDTLQMVPGEWVSPMLSVDGPGIWFDVTEVVDLIGESIDSYGTGLVVPVFGAHRTTDRSVPAELESAIAAFADSAVTNLVCRVTRQVPMARISYHGLMWIFDAEWWIPEPSNMFSAVSNVRAALLANPAGFLTGQVFGDRSLHQEGLTKGPANLPFLLSLSGESPKALLQDADIAPTWLDALASLLRRGIIVIEGLQQPGPPLPG